MDDLSQAFAVVSDALQRAEEAYADGDIAEAAGLMSRVVRIVTRMENLLDGARLFPHLFEGG